MLPFYSQSLNSNLWQPYTYGMQPFESETPMLLCVPVAHFVLLLSGIPWYQSLSIPLVKDIKVFSGLGDYKSTTLWCEHDFSFHLGKYPS